MKITFFYGFPFYENAILKTMKHKIEKHFFDEVKNIVSSTTFPAVVVFLIFAGVVYYAFQKFTVLSAQVASLSRELAIATEGLSQKDETLSLSIETLREETSGLSHSLSSTQQNVNDVKSKVGGVEQAVGSISGTVGDLQKLSRTDPELLKKYSKVFFMNENYVPAHLTPIPADMLYSETSGQQFLSEAWPFLDTLMKEAKAQGVTLYVKSAFRSFGEQESLKSLYTVTYGAGTANSFSADQGYSEHQLGTTLDFITTGLGGKLDGFDYTPAFTWLQANAHRYGFVLSYPKNNAYYVYEPWHWRFVGVKLATYLKEKNLNFYDVDQRDIDTYLISIFD